MTSGTRIGRSLSWMFVAVFIVLIDCVNAEFQCNDLPNNVSLAILNDIYYNKSKPGFECSHCQYNGYDVVEPGELHLTDIVSGRYFLSTPRVCVKHVDISVEGQFNCDPSIDDQDSLSIDLFEQSVLKPLLLPGTGMCYCPTCVSFISVTEDVSFLPGSSLTYGLRTKLGRGYISHVSLVFTVDIEPIKIQHVDPAKLTFESNLTLSFLTDESSPFIRGMLYKCIFSSSNYTGELNDIDLVIDPDSERFGTCSGLYIPDQGDKGSMAWINVSIMELDPSCNEFIYSKNVELIFERTFKLNKVVSDVSSKTPSFITISGDQLDHLEGQFGVCFFIINGEDHNNITRGFIHQGNLHCYPLDWSQITDLRSIKVQFALNDDMFSRSDTVDISFIDSSLQDFMSPQQIAVLCVLSIIGLIGDIILFSYLQKKKAVDGYEKISKGNVDVDIKDIQIRESVGKGSYAEVYSGTWRGAVVAVKRFRIADLDEEFLEAFEREVNLMRTLRSPFIIQFLGSAFVPPDNICIVTEYMARGSLYSILHNYNIPLSWELMLSMLQDCVRGMIYLHTNQPPIFHRDLKSLNLLVDDFWRCKVSDFGLSTAAVAERQENQTACGTLSWTAPEVLQNAQFSTKADVYSFGIVLWECLCRANPFQGVADFVIISQVPEGKRPDIPSWCPPPYEALMKRCWDGNPKSRPEFDEILPIIAGFSDKDKEWKEEPGFNSSHDSLLYSSSEGSLTGILSPTK